MKNMPSPPPRPRVPLTLLASVALVALLLVAGVVLIFWREWLQFAEVYPALADALRFVLFAAPVALAIGYGAAGLAILWRRYGEREPIRADKVIGLARAQRAFPDALHSLSFHDSRKQLPAPVVEPAPAPAALPPGVPSFAQLLDQGQIGPDRPLILGYSADTGAPLTGSWKDLYSCGVGAQQGAGKTWLMTFLLAQSAAAGGRLIVCDLHAGDDESLANRIAGLARAFMCDIASTPKEIAAALALADDKLERRRGNSARWPIVLVCDEWTSLLRTAAGPALTPHIQNIAEQGRKFNVNGMLAAQAWTKAASSDVRNQLTSHYVLRQRPDEARYQLGMRAAQIPDDVRSLPDATAYFLNVKGELIKVIIPHMTPADVARVGELIDRPAASGFGFQAPTAPLPAITAEAGRKRVGSDLVEAASRAAPTAKMTSPEAIRAAALFQARMSEKAIVKELRGIEGGRNYEAARDEVRNLIIEGLLSSGGQS